MTKYTYEEIAEYKGCTIYRAPQAYFWEDPHSSDAGFANSVVECEKAIDAMNALLTNKSLKE